jgi:hypothetical protein
MNSFDDDRKQNMAGQLGISTDAGIQNGLLVIAR